MFFVFSGTLIFAQADWTLDFNKSMSDAKKSKKPVLLLFTGSDWCPPCKMLERNILGTAEFENYAKENLILVKADFPRRPENQLSKEQKAQNDNLNMKFGIRGFPTVVILAPDGTELNRVVGYPGTTSSAFIQNITDKTKGISKKS
ncbi:MAG: thioredoxin family protein [Deltaproteobacteria bacterium]